MITAYVGFKAAANPRWLGSLPEPSAPSNYKDPDAIKAYVERAKIKQEEEAALTPLCGMITQANALLNTMGSTEGPRVFEVLCDAQCIVGFGIFEYLDLAIVNMIDSIGELPERFRWAKVGKFLKNAYLPDSAGRLYGRCIIDPARTLVGEYKEAELPAIMNRFGIEGFTLTTAHGRAFAAMMLAKKLGF